MDDPTLQSQAADEDTWQPPAFAIVETGLEVTGYALSDRGERPELPDAA
ncbi:pyrroloquinoline quinone precursor peptide PqqA [Streptomyces sp. A7024]|uniref:Coenzyme PQQ synthesis protein A n=1 Tax=Streptomyces coryli TaxID=1128680 RepID=A0A6G4U768_9ACTN|nr:pyrroloquinoline quinone precursor peptide PqqA [Streptomyces coryli]NGN67556.1 pyrroloquinoline quinone precursor peptide PqqA [Streptomyces coryli]